MPLTAKGSEILKNMQSEYGEAKGKEVFYASANAGKITGVHDSFQAMCDSIEQMKAACDDRRVIGGVGNRMTAVEISPVAK